MHAIPKRLGAMLAGVAATALIGIAAAQAEVTIRYMDWKLNDSQEIMELFEAAALEFEAANPDIEIELVPAQWEQRMQKLMTEIQAGLPPDVARISVPDMGALFPVLQPIDTLLEEEGALAELEAQLSQKFLDDNLRRDGRLYGVNSYISADGLMYNKRMFEAAGLDPDRPPETWDEFLDYAKRLTNPPETYGYAIFGAKSGSSARRWLRVFWDAGCEFITRDLSRAALADKPECIEAFAREVAFDREHGVVPPGVVNADFEFIITAFAQERVAMHMGGANNAVIADGRNPGIIEHLALAPMPETGATQAGGDAFVIPANASNPEASAKWIAHLMSREFNVQQGLVGKLRPARTDAMEDPRIQADPFLSFKLDPDALYSPYSTEKWGQLQEALFDMVQSALLGDETPEEAIRTTEAELNRILAQ